MAVNTTGYIYSLNTNIACCQTPVSPPLGRPENAHHSCSGRDREVCRTRVPTDIHLASPCKFVEAFEARRRHERCSGTRICQHLIRKQLFVWSNGDHGPQPRSGIYQVRQAPEISGPPKFCLPPAGRVKYRKGPGS